MRIFVGNLSFSATGEDIRKAFLVFGNVSSVDIKMKNKKAQSRGFGFVEMPNEQEAQAAMTGLQGKELLGRPLNISPARVQERQARIIPEMDKISHKNNAEVRKYPRKYDDRKKRSGESKPWQKRSGESKPWQKSKGSSRIGGKQPRSRS